jgi:hypothetical protein
MQALAFVAPYDVPKAYDEVVKQAPLSFEPILNYFKDINNNNNNFH